MREVDVVVDLAQDVRTTRDSQLADATQSRSPQPR